MANLPAVTCDYPNCRHTAEPGTRYCKEHPKQQAAPKPEQKPLWSKWYHRKPWPGLRVLVMREEPICRICERRASTIVDHIIPHKGNWQLFVDRKNLQGVCEECHNTKTATEDGGFGNKGTPGAPVATGETGKQFCSSSVGDAVLDAALKEPI